jgi:hypothetical protein
MHNHVGAVGTRDWPFDEQQTALSVNANDFQILYCAAYRTEMTSHKFARKDPSRILIHSSRTSCIVRERVTVCCSLGREVMALDHASEAFAFGGAGNVNMLPDFEQIDTNTATELEAGELFRGDPKFTQNTRAFDTGFGKMPGLSLVDTVGATITECDLDSRVSIGLIGLDLRHPVAGHVQNRHRDGIPGLGEKSGHADLTTDKS